MSDNAVILQYLQSIEGKIDDIRSSVDSHGTRINSVEMKQAEQSGVVKATLFISGLISAGISGISSYLSHH